MPLEAARDRGKDARDRGTPYVGPPPAPPAPALYWDTVGRVALSLEDCAGPLGAVGARRTCPLLPILKGPKV